MYRSDPSYRMIGLAASTAMAAVLLAGCSTVKLSGVDRSAGPAETALVSGQQQQAIAQAEAAVLAAPHNAASRAALGQAYLEAGRFASAATSFEDAVQLGDRSPRTALGKAIALMGAGDHAQAAALLSAHEGDIAPADLGLALALAGQPERGIQVMSTAIRSGKNDAKIRQNLAYAYALAGRWREARLMAAQDVPADKVGERMEQWAMTVQPEAWQARIAGLIDAPVGVADAGQPMHLALATSPSGQQLAVAVPAPAAPAPAEIAVTGELPALAVAEAPAAPIAELPAVAAAPATTLAFDDAFAAPAPAPVPAPAPTPAVLAVVQDTQRFVTPVPAPVATSAPAATRVTAAAPQPTPRAAAATRAPAGQSTHLVQLGSFSTEASARRAWSIYQKRYPELSGHQMVISEAVVRGKHYYRVSAAGFGRSSSAAMCGRVQSSGGEGCFAYAEGRPLPGAIDRGTRLAMR